MRIGRGNGNTWRKPAPVPLCPPQIPHGLNWARTQAGEVGSRQLTLSYGTASTPSYTDSQEISNLNIFLDFAGFEVLTAVTINSDMGCAAV
jgi:hypothetical protein